MASHTEEIKKHVRVYILVFALLAFLTLVTVAVSYLKLATWATIAVALFVATVKGSLVASYFMHLIAERKLIYLLLVFTLIFFAGLILLPTADVSLHRSLQHVP